jgi:hypothetical protein
MTDMDPHRQIGPVTSNVFFYVFLMTQKGLKHLAIPELINPALIMIKC